MVCRFATHRRSSWFARALPIAALVGGCSSTPPALAAPDHDRPVPADAPREEIHLAVDLEPAQDCEERFDLALYTDRGVDRVQWDDAVGRCVGRHVTIVILTKSLSRQALLGKVKDLARRVEETPSAHPAKAPATTQPSGTQPQHEESRRGDS